jgi:hypothetical protein
METNYFKWLIGRANREKEASESVEADGQLDITVGG